MTLLLVYGNTLRRDDGAAHAVAERLEPTKGLTVVTCRQLLPEHTELLASVDRVILVDAAVGIDAVTVQAIHAEATGAAFNHTCRPEWLLALALLVNRRCPVAWLVSIPAFDLGLGEGLTPATARAVEVALARIRELCTNLA